MDEFMFRSSQQLELLQYQMGVAASEGTKVIKQLSFQTRTAVIDTLNSPLSMQIQETVSNFCYYCWTVLDEVRCTILYHTNPRMIFHNITKALGSHWSKRDVIFGCTGIIVGSLLGIGIGLAIQRKNGVLKHMLAVQCMSYTGIEGASTTDEAIASTFIRDDEVLISVKATSVHVIDADICSGYGKSLRQLLSSYQYSKHDLPVTLGRDCTGIIVDIGKNVTRFDIGDEVWTTSPFWAQGTMSQFFIANEVDVGLKPENAGYEGACSFPYAGGIALSILKTLETTPEKLAGMRIFVQGCCTPVGCILVQLFKLWNAHVTVTCFKRSVPVADALKCDDIIIIDTTEVRGDNGQHVHVFESEANMIFKELMSRKHFDIVINTRKCGLEEEQFREFCPKGIFLSTTHQPLPEDSYRFPSSFVFNSYVKSKAVCQLIFGRQIRNFGEVHICHQTLDQLRELVDKGKLKILVDKVFYPSDIENALYHIQSTDSIGSTVITFR